MVALDADRLQDERHRLVRQCYRLTGDIEAAEDLAQETLLEAVRNAHKLRDLDALGPWYAIAVNVCRRWSSTRGKVPVALAPEWDVSDSCDLEVELDPKDLIFLLDRALALLPPDSREVLIERYVRESPHAEIAARLGLSEYAVTKRVERGKLHLKRVLSTTLIHDAVSHGLEERMLADWEATDIWCPNCGVRRLLGRIFQGMLWLICKPCGSIPVALFATLCIPRGLRGCRAICAADHARHYRSFKDGIAGSERRCTSCGDHVPYQLLPQQLDGSHHARWECPCRPDDGWEFSSAYQLLSSPQGSAFWRDEDRIRFLPEREAEADGVPDAVGPGPLYVVGGLWAVGVALLAWSNPHLRSARIGVGI